MSEEMNDNESFDAVKRKPGRPPKQPEEARSAEDQIASARARRERRRAEIGTGDYKLAAPQRAGFVRRWVNDVVGRVDRFKSNGWDPVTDHGVDVRHVGGAKAPLNAVLMEIPEEFYNEDQQKKLARVVDPRQMAENKAKSKTDESPEEYIPGGKDSALAVDKLR